MSITKKTLWGGLTCAVLSLPLAPSGMAHAQGESSTESLSDAAVTKAISSINDSITGRATRSAQIRAEDTSIPTSDSAIRSAVATSIAFERQAEESIEKSMEETPLVKVIDVKTSLDDSESYPDGRILTMRVSRKLDDGHVWEELVRYVVVDSTDLSLPRGSFRRIDEEGMTDKSVRTLSSSFPGEISIHEEMPRETVDQAPGSSEGTPASTTPPPKGTPEISAAGSPANRNAIVKYAHTYALKPNPKYHEYGTDCTNFVSQAMAAGGWGQIRGWYRSDSVWWYSGNWKLWASWTWTSAEHWYRFARNTSKRAGVVNNVYKLRPGDVLQYKGSNSPEMNHSMVVTGTSHGVPLLSYHTKNTKDKPFTAMNSKGLTWFAHSIR